MRLALAAFVAVLVLATPAAAQAPLDGPDGTSLNKVLVIGVDGMRWDLLEAAMRGGRAPNLARLRREGFARSSLLDYGPNTLTLSEVGWSSIASGVWDDKHGIDGTKLNMDPGQATKNGYLDFLTRIEQARPRLSTFIASDWDNLGLPLNGGPIFGTAMDANFAARVPREELELWNQGDIAVTNASARYLRNGNPDAGFVYLGLVDETAHLVGSATPSYREAIWTTDGRIGRLLRAIRARPTYRFESWTVLVTTDHGERPLTEPSLVAHFGKTELELRVFVLGSGPGLGGVRRARIVDVLPTVMHQLGLPVRRSWNLDGRSLSRARPPSAASARLRGDRLKVRLQLGARPRVRRVALHLPGRVEGGVRVLVNGKQVAFAVSRRTVGVSVPRGGLRSLSLAANVAGQGKSMVVTMPGGKLAIPLR
jgi:hypothetical protein